MPIGLLKDISSTCPKGKRLLGLDLGTKTIGLALADGNHSIATPLRTIQRTKFTRDIQDMHREITDFEVGGYVLGYPLNMDGTAGPRCESVRHFADEMRNHPDIFGKNPWIALWDERLSTAAVEDFLIETVDMSRTKRKQVIDALAAQHILQGALDYLAVAHP
jgi:putative Holliday junction resolvase